jgi:hypothetical protein
MKFFREGLFLKQNLQKKGRKLFVCAQTRYRQAPHRDTNERAAPSRARLRLHRLG